MAVADVGGHGGYVFRAQELLCRPCQEGRGYQCRSAARDLFESKSGTQRAFPCHVRRNFLPGQHMPRASFSDAFVARFHTWFS